MKLGPHSIWVHRPSVVPADYGNGTKLDYSNVVGTRVDECSVQPAPSDEYAVDRDSITTRLIVFAPLSADIKATDRIEWSGETYDIDGDVLRWEFGALSHLVVNLRRSEG
jgi:hypothetical protein